MVIAPEEFMGSHSKEVKGRGEQGKAASNQLKKRFGHWHAKLEGKQELSNAMHKEGARGLQLFGYTYIYLYKAIYICHLVKIYN
jgi:hypothetical protein